MTGHSQCSPLHAQKGSPALVPCEKGESVVCGPGTHWPEKWRPGSLPQGQQLDQFVPLISSDALSAGGRARAGRPARSAAGRFDRQEGVQ